MKIPLIMLLAIISAVHLSPAVTAKEPLRERHLDVVQGLNSGTSAEWPPRFKRHMFGAFCFNTLTCSVIYDGRDHGTARATPSMPGTHEHDQRLRGSYGDIRNFGSAPVVQWQPRTGAPISARVDFATLFPDHLIRHSTRRDDIPEGISMGFTHVLLEVNDRTLIVYTRTLIPLNQPLIPGNRFSSFRDELIKVYSQTY
jgi:hypothetical protein